MVNKDGNTNTIFVVIVAAGSGTRFGSTIPKQFLPLVHDGRTVLMHTVDAFLKAKIEHDNIRVVLNKEMIPLWEELCKKHQFNSPRIVEGGATRFDSVRNALTDIVDDSNAIVLIHDGVRPLVTGKLIHDVCSRVHEGRGVVPAVPFTDSLRYILTEGNSKSVNRAGYVKVQTPQGFRLREIKQAYASATHKDFTDDASVFEAAGFSVDTVHGDERNIKITKMVDLDIVAILAEGKSKL